MRNTASISIRRCNGGMRSNLDIAGAVDVLRGLLPGHAALHEPEFRGNEWAYVKDCLDTGWVSSVGSYVDRIEKDLCSLTGAKYAVATVNGTESLHVALLLADVEPENEVLVPTLTFVATANAVVYCRATPHFVDSDASTLGVDPHKLAAYLDRIAERRDGRCVNRASGRTIRALIVMHAFGHPADLDALVALCRDWNITLIEDAAESLGSNYKGRHTGTFGRIGTLSFNGNKIVTTGGGGAILTDDAELGRLAKHVTTTAKLPHKWAFRHDRVGFNFRMPNVNAAIGCAQLERLDDFVTRKRRLAETYRNAFSGFPGLSVFVEPAFARSNYWLNLLLLDDDCASGRDGLLAASNEAGIQTRPAWEPMHRLPMYAGCPRMDLSVAEDLVRRLINVPSSPALADARASSSRATA